MTYAFNIDRLLFNTYGTYTEFTELFHYLVTPMETLLFMRGTKKGFNNCTCQKLSSAINKLEVFVH